MREKKSCHDLWILKNMARWFPVYCILHLKTFLVLLRLTLPPDGFTKLIFCSFLRVDRSFASNLTITVWSKASRNVHLTQA